MTSERDLASKLKAIAALAAELPKGAQVTIDWTEAPTDVLLAVVLLRGGRLRFTKFVGGGSMQYAVWKYRGIFVRAQQRIPALGSGGAQLSLVKP